MFKPGDIVTFRYLVEYEPTTGCICRSASTYGYGLDLELRPSEDRLYVVRQGDNTKGYTLMDLDDKEKPIGYIISSRGYRISRISRISK